MALSTTDAGSPEEIELTAPRSRWSRRPDELVVLAVALVGLLLAVITHGHHLQGLPGIARGAVASLLLFAVCGDALAWALLPRTWGALGPLFSVPLGAAASGLVLTALGLAHVPLHVSLWLTLAAGGCASVIVRRRGTRAATGPRIDRRALGLWLAALFVLFCVALMPAWRTSADTIYGQNPDAHQVAGIAVLFQHVPPTATDVALPIDTVPPSWRFRYPIFYSLAAASNLSHDDPIRVFPAMAALLIVVAALGFGALAVQFLGAPAAAGPAVAAAIGLSSITLHLGWHPYWNQLWGFAMLPYALLFGWRALAAGDGRAGVLFVLMLVTIGLAYPLALPYPLLIVGALAIAYWRRPRLPASVRSHAVLAGALALLVLAPAVAGAAVKLGQGLSQLFSPHSSLWGGDVTHLMPVGRFVGTGGGVLPTIVVVGVAALGLRALPRRPRLALGLALLVLGLVDLRFRLASSGAYMDFKHLSFVGAVILVLAASAVARLVSSRSRAAIVAGAALGLAWVAAALVQDRREGFRIPQQVPSAMFQIRTWAKQLPPGASVRIDIPPSGVQLWAVYMLGDHPVDSLAPIRNSTYAHARVGARAGYSLSLRHYPGTPLGRPFPPTLFAENPPLFENDEFVLRRIAWPARYAAVSDTSSTTLVEP